MSKKPAPAHVRPKKCGHCSFRETQTSGCTCGLVRPEDLVTSADGLDRPFWLVLADAGAPERPAPQGQKKADFNGDGIVNFADFFEESRISRNP